MDEGSVVESGTHEELLQNESGVYSLLVSAQKLRNSEQNRTDLDDTVVREIPRRVSGEEVYSGRRSSIYSVVSHIVGLEQVEQQPHHNPDGTFGLFYVLRRLGNVNRDQWKRYVIGFILSIRGFLLVGPI